MIKKIEKITKTIIEIMTNVFLTVAMFILMLFAIFAVGVMVYGLTHQKFDYSCAYCREAITEGADYVCMTDGRKMHAECYMRAIMEDTNG